MEQIVTVLLFAVVILIITLIAARLPHMIEYDARRAHAMVAFSAGVMLGVLFLMLMPEAIERTLDAGYDSEIVCYMMLVGFVLLFVIDYLVKKYLNPSNCGCDSHVHDITSMSAFAGLAIHSFFDGVALAAAFIAEENVGYLVLLALCLHKAIVAFSLGSTLVMSKNRAGWKYLLAFSVISPIATVISYFLLGSGNMDFAGPALCFSVGIFMFVTFFDIMPEAFHKRNNDNNRMIVVIAGLLLVWVVSMISSFLMGGIEI